MPTLENGLSTRRRRRPSRRRSGRAGPGRPVPGSASQVVRQERLQVLRHPDQPLVAALGVEEPCATSGTPCAAIKPGVCEPPRRWPASDEKVMPAGSRPWNSRVDGHDAVALRHVGQDDLEAAATGHRFVHDRVGAERRDRLVAFTKTNSSDPGQTPRTGSRHSPFRTAGSGRSRRSHTRPCRRASCRRRTTRALGRDHADVVRRERLAQQAGVERVDRLVGHRTPGGGLRSSYTLRATGHAAARPSFGSVTIVTFTLSTIAG